MTDPITQVREYIEYLLKRIEKLQADKDEWRGKAAELQGAVNFYTKRVSELMDEIYQLRRELREERNGLVADLEDGDYEDGSLMGDIAAIRDLIAEVK